LAHLAAQTNDAVHRRTARAAVEHVRRSLREGASRTSIGFYSGTVGIGYALIDLDNVLHAEGLAELGLATLRACPSRWTSLLDSTSFRDARARSWVFSRYGDGTPRHSYSISPSDLVII
jgi:hypothetical protein